MSSARSQLLVAYYWPCASCRRCRKHAAAFNSGEFFQGAFEMVDDATAVLLWLGTTTRAPWVSAPST